MALLAAATCPQPPLLVPELAAGAAGELDALRAACRAAVAAVAAADPELTFVVGVDASPRARSLAPWGVDVAVDVPEPLPLSLLVGGWLTRGRHRSFVAVDPALDPAEAAELGAELAGAAARVGLVVMGDGSARRSVRAPGYEHPAAEGFDEQVAAALGEADAAALAAIDPATAEELMCSGRVPWQVLAGAAAAGPALHGRLLHQDAPYGVGYLVAVWSAA